MKMGWYEQVCEVADKLDWNVEDEIFSKYTPANQDFTVNLTVTKGFDVFLEELNAIIDNYDCSEEAYHWLDNTGHGKNGAPYDMKDVYEDMEACLANMEELRDAIEQLEIEDEEEKLDE